MRRILAIGLDAVEPSLIEKWMEDDTLPHLRSLRERGLYGRLGSVAEWLAEAAPYSFYTGQNPAAHGAHCFIMWQKDEMRLKPPAADWIPMRPFWRAFGEDQPRAIVVDAPLVYAPEPFHGLEIVGWATHDTLIPFSTCPQHLAKWVRARYGASLMSDELYGLISKRDFIATRNETLKIAARFADLCVALMRAESWDLFLAFLFSAHHAGHRLWNTMNIKDSLTMAEETEFSASLRQVYIACDNAVGSLVESAGPDTVVMVFSLHGMGENNSRTWILPEMLRQVLVTKQNDRPLTGTIKRIRALIPLPWRHQVKSRLPFYARSWLTRFWRSMDFNWAQTRAFPLASDTQGWVRINVKGREALGIVEQGEEYDALCQQIGDGLKTFVDMDTGEPLVKDILRPHQVFEGERMDDLPDLIVRWADSPAAMHRAVVSPRFGMIPWPTPGHNPEGRSGNHRPEGVLMVAGKGIKSGTINGAHILDLAPTILTLLGQPIPAEMEGKPLSIINN